jgi:molecular chaperone GrpE
MSLENLNDKSFEEIELEAVSSFDDFLKELEEAEKNLHITATDTVVEVEDSFDDSPSADYEVQAAAEEFALETFAAAEGPGASLRDKSQTANEINDLRVKISTLEEERGELRQALVRRQTDFDNFRKRTERERSETFENILSKLSSKMLPVLDNLSRALESSRQLSSEKVPEFEHFVQGILLVNQQLTDVLEEMGVQPILSVGHQFDPHFHEAVATVENAGEEPGTVVEEMLTGYTIGKQVIRPAMVKVSVAPSVAAPAAVDTVADDAVAADGDFAVAPDIDGIDATDVTGDTVDTGDHAIGDNNEDNND